MTYNIEMRRLATPTTATRELTAKAIVAAEKDNSPRVRKKMKNFATSI